MGRKYLKSFAGVFFLLAAAVFCQGWNAGALWGLSPTWQSVEGVAKDEVVQDDDDVLVGAGRKANVLFLLDTGSQMSFTPIGTMPEWGANVTTREGANDLLAQSTYGHGGLPVYGGSSAQKERYGRDLDKTNNAALSDFSLSAAAFMEKHADNYYFPFNYAGNPLGSLVSGAGSYALPYALVYRQDSKAATALSYWRGLSKPGSQSGLDDLLMPNDSRMYKMKLVMWRLLDDASLFGRLRIGMATTFQEHIAATASYLADFYKASPYGVDENRYPEYTNGTGPDWATGLSGSSGYGHSQAAYWGIDRGYYELARSSVTWRLINRAYLRVPISDYSKDHAALFRLWIDGYEDVRTGGSPDPFYYKNPELFADGKTFLSTAIYPGHNNLSRATLLSQTDGRGRTNSGIAFSNRAAGTNFTTSANAGTKASCFNVLKGGTGEALGTVLDFFSPPVKNIGGAPASAYNVTLAPATSFPIVDNCESNWVIIFTAGDDSSEYHTDQAVLDLFKHTKNNAVTSRTGQTGTTNQFKGIQLDDGVRTIVVGFVDPVSSAENVVALRKKLNKVAAAGNPKWNGGDWVPDESKTAYFANDVPKLMEAMRAILTQINAEIRPAKGPMTESAALETGSVQAGDFDLYSASYKVNNEDQWQGQLTRYRTNIDSSGNITIGSAKWELGDALLKTRSKSGARSLSYWNGSGYTKLNYSTGTTEYNSTVPGYLGLRDEDQGTPARYVGKLHPSRAMINWLHGYDYNYSTSTEAERKFLLSDFGQSGILVVKPPAAGALTLTGYDAWVSAQANRDIRLYAQSNDGILHVVSPTSSGAGLEEMAIIPPPVMQPFRLAATKFTVAESGTELRADWDDNTISEDVGYGSRPAYLLDGPLFLRNFDLELNGTDWGTFLIGMLGRAGNGLYLMDVTKPKSPTFLWYRETRYQSDGRPVLITMGGGETRPTYTQDTSTSMASGGPLYSNPDKYPFYQMGYNMPAPAAGVARFANGNLRNILILSGGMQEELDLTNNGTVGAALYIVDPRQGYQPSASSQNTKVFNSGSLPLGKRAGSSVTGSDPYMGMLVTPPALLRSGTTKSIAGKIFTADNRGNIFMVNLEDGFGASAVSLAEKDWTIQTVGTLRNKTGESGASNNHCIPTGILVSFVSNTGAVWVSGGTSNIGTRNNDSVLNNSALIRNDGQHIFSFGVAEDELRYRSDLTLLTNSVLAAPSGSPGWYIKLQEEVSGYQEEYVTVRPVLLGDKIVTATFIPNKVSASCESAVDGISRIYAMGLLDGAEGWGGRASGGRYIEIRGIKVAGLTHSKQGNKETVIVSYAVTNKATSDIDLAALASQGLINLAQGAPMFTLDVDAGVSGVSPPFAPTSSYINSWKEGF